MASHFDPGAPRALNRRTFLKAGLAATVAIPYIAAPIAQDRWRTFELQVRVDLNPTDRVSQLWLPLPLAGSAPYQRTDAQTWTGNSQTARVVADRRSGASMLRYQIQVREIA